jgi:hypothetical protein
MILFSSAAVCSADLYLSACKTYCLWKTSLLARRVQTARRVHVGYELHVGYNHSTMVSPQS